MNNYTTIRNLNKWLVFTVCSLLIVVFQSGNAIAQTNDKFGFNELEGLFESHPQHKYTFSKDSQHVNNEIDFLMASGFIFYKSFLSSQDNPSCIFYPSCSEYSINAIQQKGLILGLFYTFDRLSRCHRLVKSDEYVFDESKQRFYDPLH